jgi:hypothetical protein
MVKVRSSRRVAGLKLTDYDHEIGLVNHDEVDGDSNTVLSSAAGTRSGSTTSRLVSLVGDSEVEVEAQAEGTGTNENDAIERPNGNNADGSQEDQNSLQPEDTLPHPSMQPSIEVQGSYLCECSDSYRLKANSLVSCNTGYIPRFLRSSCTQSAARSPRDRY